MKTLQKSLLASVGTLCIAATAHADPTDYIAVPIADIQKPGHFVLELVQTAERFDDDSDEELATSFLTEFGITEKLEAGVDFNRVNDDAVIEADIKYQFLDPSENTWGLASGLTGLGSDDVDPFFYVTGTRNVGKGSISAGAGSDGDVTAFFGASYPITKRLTTTGEFFTDESGFALVSATYKITDHLSFATWYQDFNQSDEERLQVDLIFQGRF